MQNQQNRTERRILLRMYFAVYIPQIQSRVVAITSSQASICSEMEIPTFMHHCTNHTENIGQIMRLKPIRKFGFRFWLVRLIALLLPETSIREDYIWMMHIRYHVWVSGVFKYTRILKSGRDLWQFHVPFEHTSERPHMCVA